MASHSIHELYNAEEIEHMKQHLRKYPIDHRYDEECETFDGDPPIGQDLSRVYYTILVKLGELPDDIPG